MSPETPTQARDDRAQLPSPSAALMPPELLDAKESSRLCGLSRSTWWAHCSAGLVPAPVHIGGRALWRRRELVDWAAAGAPPRSRWVWALCEEGGCRCVR